MRVRLFRLRLVAVVLASLWTATTIVLLAAYRPGGPFDPAVSIATAAGVAASVAALVWPPLARGTRAGVFVGWLGLGAILLAAPSLLNLVGALHVGETSPFLPSPEAAYAWLAALGATCLYAGLGISRHILGGTSLRRQRLALASVIALAIVGVAGGISAVAALSTELALRDRAATASDWGPTDQALVPPVCADGASAGTGARVMLTARAAVDGREIGEAGLSGTRNGNDEAWSGWMRSDHIATIGEVPGAGATPGADEAPGSPTSETAFTGSPPAVGEAVGGHAAVIEYVRVGASAWVRDPDSAWRPATTADSSISSLDRAVVAVALSNRARLAAEDLGTELVGGARARHCRLLVDGPVALAAFRPLRWLIGQPALSDESALHDWRGELDWWVFADRELGMAEVSVDGIAPGVWTGGGVRGTLEARLTARGRSGSYTITAPVP